MDHSHEDLNKRLQILACKHKTFFNADLNYKQNLAKQVLQKLQLGKWAYINNWIEKSCQIEGLLPTDSYEIQQMASMKKFNMGSIAKLWLTTFINTPHISKPNKIIGPNGEYLNGPFSMGMNAPGIQFDLFCDPNQNDTKNIYKKSAKQESVCLVLGAGNQDFLTLIDIFQRVFIHNECVIVKHHPLRNFLYEPYSLILEPLIYDDIVFMIEDENIDNSIALTKHSLITHIHFTGSEKTYNSINKTLRFAKKNWNVSGELGCVTPWVVFPEKWTENEIKSAAKQIVTAKKTNGGCNCLSSQLIILPFNWEQKADFMQELTSELLMQKTIPSYYPNSLITKSDFEFIYKKDSTIIPSNNKLEGVTEEDNIFIINYGLISNNRQNDYCLKNEAFGPILVLAEVENDNLDHYLDNVISILNSDKVYGSLSCSLLVPSAVPDKYVDYCILNLNYGTIAINTWSIFGYTAAAMGGVWGGYYKDIKSGYGRVGNIFQNEFVTKTIVRNNSLENSQIDLSKLPPKFILDLLFVLIVKTNNSFDVAIEFVFFLFEYLIITIINFNWNYILKVNTLINN